MEMMQEMRNQPQKKKAQHANVNVSVPYPKEKTLIIWNILITAGRESGIKIITREPSQSLYI